MSGSTRGGFAGMMLAAGIAAAAAAMVFCPAQAAAHASEFILAKVTPLEGRVTLELTVDCSGESLIGSEAEAREVLARALRVRTTDGSRDLTALAPMQFERRTQIDPAAPIPRDPEDDAKPHRLVCGTWSWDCGGGSVVSFEAPEGLAGGQSVILWTAAPIAAGRPGQASRWVMLVGGDISPEISIPHRPVAAAVAAMPWIFAVAGVALVGMCVPAWRRLQRKPEPMNGILNAEC